MTKPNTDKAPTWFPTNESDRDQLLRLRGTINDLLDRRDELLEALKECCYGGDIRRAITNGRSTIAKVEARTPGVEFGRTARFWIEQTGWLSNQLHSSNLLCCELQKQRDELFAALKAVFDNENGSLDGTVLKRVMDTIAKVEDK